MKFFSFMAAAAALAVGNATAQREALSADILGNSFMPREKRGKGQRNKRGKGALSKPKKRSNRLHISKRVRRAHRRAA